MTDETEERLMPWIPGQYLARASYYLPDPATDTEQFREVEVVLRIRYERKCHRLRSGARHCFWTPDSAVLRMPEGIEPRERQLVGQLGDIFKTGARSVQVPDSGNLTII